MAIDLKNMSSKEVAHHLNKIARFALINPGQVQYHIEKAAFPIGEGNRVNILHYAAWLKDLADNGKYFKRKVVTSQADIMRARRAQGRDIGEIPLVAEPKRKEKCQTNLELFLKTYLPDAFPLEFSKDHKRILLKMQESVLAGGLNANGVYRGWGKTSIAEGAVIWCVSYGHRKYVPVIAADLKAAVDILDSIKTEYEENDLLYADFPEICYPIRELEGIAHRCTAQSYDGKHTHITWKTETLVMPTMPESPASGVIIKAFGLTGRIRGLKHKLPDGSTVRPDYAFIDDPQTDSTAKSPTQCDTREDLITGAVLGLTGHTKKMSAIMNCTIIKKGDLADRFLDKKEHPEWQGETVPMVYQWADRHDDLWMGKYQEIRKQDIPDSDGGRKEAERQATKYYLANRKEMDNGCKVAWEHCYESGEISAIQHAYNLLIDRGEYIFMSEYQNEPLDEFEGVEPALEPVDIFKKLNKLDRYNAPSGFSTLVSFIDVHGKQIHWATIAFGDYFSGAIMDYGVAKITRGRRGGIEAAVTEALKECVRKIKTRPYFSDDGESLKVENLIIDSGWQSRVVYAFCNSITQSPLVIPSKGQGGEFEVRPPKLTPRRNYGSQWCYAMTKARDAKLMIYNTDYWKSFVNERLRTGMGGLGCLSIWGKSPRVHRTLAEHLCSERPTEKTKKTGDVFAKWNLLPGRPNHWLDCVVGCHVAAARLGCELKETQSAEKKKPKRKKQTLSSVFNR